MKCKPCIFLCSYSIEGIHEIMVTKKPAVILELLVAGRPTSRPVITSPVALCKLPLLSSESATWISHSLTHLLHPMLTPTSHLTKHTPHTTYIHIPHITHMLTHILHTTHLTLHIHTSHHTHAHIPHTLLHIPYTSHHTR